MAILCGANKSFLLNLWDLLLRQAEHTLNMLRPSQMTPTVSAYTYLWGQHDYNANPFAPMGCKVEAHIVPGIRKTWAPHTASSYYVGAAWEHYRCHDIHISDTRHTRVCSSVFFKHKYLTIPTLTATDALIRAVDNLTKALAGVIPPPNMTTDAIDQLINIFKTQAEKKNDKVTVQRVLKEQAATQRVRNKAATTTTSPPLPPLEVTYPDLNPETPRGVPVISQDDDPPAAHTQQQQRVRTLTQDMLFHMMDVRPKGLPQPFKPRQAARCNYPLQSLCDFAYTVLDDKTGDLLEYRHLLKHPKYKDVWSQSFGKEIRRLATVTKTIAFLTKQEIPHA